MSWVKKMAHVNKGTGWKPRNKMEYKVNKSDRPRPPPLSALLLGSFGLCPHSTVLPYRVILVMICST